MARFMMGSRKRVQSKSHVSFRMLEATCPTTLMNCMKALLDHLGNNIPMRARTAMAVAILPITVKIVLAFIIFSLLPVVVPRLRVCEGGLWVHLKVLQNLPK